MDRLSKLWMLVEEERRSKEKQIPINLDNVRAYIEKTVRCVETTFVKPLLYGDDLFDAATSTLISNASVECIFSSTLRSRKTGAPPLIIFGKIFRTLPLLLQPPRLLIFDY